MMAHRLRPLLCACLAAGIAGCVANGAEVPPAPSMQARSGQDGAPSTRDSGAGRDAFAGGITAERIDRETGFMVESTQTGIASWYGPGFHGRQTANGEIFDREAMTAAHRTWPMNTLVRVTRLDTGDSLLLRINDRGPFIDGRIIDVSEAAARALGFLSDGLTEVRIDNLGPAREEDRAAPSRIRRRETAQSL